MLIEIPTNSFQSTKNWQNKSYSTKKSKNETKHKRLSKQMKENNEFFKKNMNKLKFAKKKKIFKLREDSFISFKNSTTNVTTVSRSPEDILDSRKTERGNEKEILPIENILNSQVINHNDLHIEPIFSSYKQNDVFI